MGCRVQGSGCGVEGEGRPVSEGVGPDRSEEAEAGRVVEDVHLPLLSAPFGTVINLRTTSSQNYEAVARKARILGSQTFVSLNSRLESNEEGERSV